MDYAKQIMVKDAGHNFRRIIATQWQNTLAPGKWSRTQALSMRKAIPDRATRGKDATAGSSAIKGTGKRKTPHGRVEHSL